MASKRSLSLISSDKAAMFGMPHAGARYTGRGVARYARTQDECAICGARGQSVHHTASRGLGERVMETPNGDHLLRPALMLLCGTGTTGCHGDIEDGRMSVRWEWYDPADAERWADGSLLCLFGPHDPGLYDLGRWVVERRGEAVCEITGSGRRAL